jgi:hypothetical protein
MDQPMDFWCDISTIPNYDMLMCNTPPANMSNGVRIYTYYRDDMPNNRKCLDDAQIPVIGSYETSSPFKSNYYLIPKCKWTYDFPVPTLPDAGGQAQTS